VVKLLDSLLDAIVRLEGDALVMHVGEKPYVVTASASMNAYRGPLAWGQVELSSRVLTFDAVSSMLAEILPLDQQQALDEFGAIEHQIAAPDGVGEGFTVVAARGGEDVWVEVRRRPGVVPKPETAAEQPVVPAAAPTEPVAAEHSESAQQDDAVAATPVGTAAAVAVAPPPEEAPAIHDEQQKHAEEQPAPESQQIPGETIVVALPGDVTEEVPLSAVPENAIQLVDEEPQDVPTEEEVDAMLAATAAALLTSGLGAERIVDEIDEQMAFEATSFGTPIGTAAPDVAEPLSEPAFELSPPPPEGVVEEPEAAGVEPMREIPAGAPLFSDEAMLAAAAPPGQDVVSETGQAEDTAAVAETLADAPIQEPPPLLMPEDVSAQVSVWRAALRALANEPAARAGKKVHRQMTDDDAVEYVSGSTRTSGVPPQSEDTRPAVHEISSELPVSSTLNADAEQAVSQPTPHVWVPPPAEMPMDVTPEPRNEEPVAQLEDRAAPLSAETDEPALHAHADDEVRQAVVVPLSRTPIKPESVSVPFTPAEDAALMHTLRIAAARGAATVYVVAQSKPMVRVDGEISPLESEPTLTAADVDRLVMELAPPRRRDALQNGPVEWLCDVPEIGRVRCLTFRDHRGPGVLFRMFPPRAISADQLGLTPEVQALCQQSDGLVLVTGARASGKSTLLNAFVDLINRTRSDHVITIETQIGFVHESRRSFISQRESRGDGDLAATFVRAALREDPDVMMIEDLKSAEIVAAALEAAESGRLVLASVPAASTIGALERLIEVFAAERRPKARTSLASSLRGVIAQVLLRRVKGGRVAAREVLLNTPAVSTLVLEGKMFQLPVALDSGRRHGMLPLTDSLAAHVREGTVHVAEAYRKALDRAALVALLKREGIDTSFAERLA